MGAVWYKRRHLPSELDADGMPLPGVLPVGLWCEDKATLDYLVRGTHAKGVVVRPELAGAPMQIGGTPVYVATQAQAELLRAMPAALPEDVMAAEQAEFDDASQRLRDLVARLKAAKPAPAETTHDARGAHAEPIQELAKRLREAMPPAKRTRLRVINRQAKRRAAALARRAK